MNLYSLWLFLHILGIVCIAAPLLVNLSTMLLGSNPNKDVLVGVYRLGDVSGRYLSSIGGAVALITGLIMVATSDDPDVGWGKLWIWTAIVLFVISAAMGAAVTGPAGQRAATLLTSGDSSYQAAATQLRTYGYIQIILWVIIVALMVFKPF